MKERKEGETERKGDEKEVVDGCAALKKKRGSSNTKGKLGNERRCKEATGMKERRGISTRKRERRKEKGIGV